MLVFKCKMCGGTVEVKDGEKSGVCDSCGTVQFLPLEQNASPEDKTTENNSSDELKSKVENAINAGAASIGKVLGSVADSVADEAKEVKADPEKKKKLTNIILGIVFLFVFWPASIYFFIKAFKTKDQ